MRNCAFPGGYESGSATRWTLSLDPPPGSRYLSWRDNCIRITRFRLREGPLSGQVLGIVPARLASTRLPNKPLYPLLGRPLIEWVWWRIEGMSVLDHAVVATDSEEVAEVCTRLGAPVLMTSSEHPSGTDRVAEVADRPEFADYEYIANVQGDEPLLKENHLRLAIDLVRQAGWDVGTCATPLMVDAARNDASVVKVARAANGRALYFSRAGIPYKRDEKPLPEELAREPFLRQIGIYAYTRDALHDWVAMAPSQLEKLELLEQLRPLEAGLRIGVAVVGAADPGVDTPADVIRMEEQLRRQMGATTMA